MLEVLILSLFDNNQPEVQNGESELTMKLSKSSSSLFSVWFQNFNIERSSINTYVWTLDSQLFGFLFFVNNLIEMSISKDRHICSIKISLDDYQNPKHSKNNKIQMSAYVVLHCHSYLERYEWTSCINHKQR